MKANKSSPSAPSLSVVAICLCCAFILRSIFAFGMLNDMPMVSDAADYAEDARYILENFPPDKSFYLPPGNSLVLASAASVLGSSTPAFRLMVVLLSTLAVVMVVHLAELLYDRETVEGKPDNATGFSAYWTNAKLWSGLIAVAYAPAVLLSGQTYSQHLAAVCMLGVAIFGIRALDRGRPVDFALSGLWLGLGCITRPSMVAVVIAMLIFGVRRLLEFSNLKEKLQFVWRTGLLALCCVAFIVPVALHNYTYGAGWTVSTNNERNFFLGNNPYTPDYKTSHLGQRSLEELPPETAAYLRHFYSLPEPRQAMMDEAIRYIIANPLRTLYRTINRTQAFWGFDYIASRQIQNSLNLGKSAFFGLLLLEAGAYIAVIGLAIVGLFGCWSSLRKEPALFCLALVLSYMLPYTLAFSGGSYHFPVIGLLMPFAGLAMAQTPRRLIAELFSNRFIQIALLVLLIVQVQYAYQVVLLS